MNSVSRVFSLLLGGVLLAIGVLGFIPLLTPDGKLLGLFYVNTLHGLAHILTGVLGIAVGWVLSDRYVRLYTAMMAAIYGVLALLGWLHSALLQALLDEINLPDNILHTTIFVFALLVCVSAIWEYQSLQRMQELAVPLPKRASPSSAGALSPMMGGPSSGFASGLPSGFASRPSSPGAVSGVPRRATSSNVSNVASAPGRRPTGDFGGPVSPPPNTGSQQEFGEYLTWLEQEARAGQQLRERVQNLEEQLRGVQQAMELLRGQVEALSRIQRSAPTPQARSVPGSYPSAPPRSQPSQWPPRQSSQSSQSPQSSQSSQSQWPPVSPDSGQRPQREGGSW